MHGVRSGEETPQAGGGRGPAVGTEGAHIPEQLDRGALQRQGNEPAALDFGSDEVGDGRRHPVAVGGRRRGGGLAPEDPQPALGDCEPAQQPGDVAPRIGASGADQPILTGQRGGRHGARRQAVAGTRHHHEAIAHQRLAHQIGEAGAEPDVGQPFEEKGRHLGFAGEAHRRLHQPGTARENRQETRSQELGDGAGGDDPQQLRGPLGVPDGGFGLDGQVDHLGGDRHQPFPARGEVHPGRGPLHERIAEMLTEGGQGTRHRRFAHAQHLRRRLDGTEAGDQHERLQLGQSHETRK